jgi:predicted DNA-binding transcriptional regulator YafY
VGRHGAFKDRPLWRRLQTIHHEIKEGRHPNTRSLGELLSVSSKTVQRDIDYLRDELDAPIEFLREENGYAYSRDDYVLPFLPVDGQDLFSIGVAAQVMALLGGTPLSRTLRSCYERLARLMPPAVRLRPEAVREQLTLRATAFRPVREETWQAVSDALQKGVALSIRYRHPGEGPGEPRVIRPYAFVLAGRDWMVLAEDTSQAQIKNFYLARIDEARLTRERYAIAGFDASSSSATRSACSWAAASRFASACASRRRSRTRCARWSGTRSRRSRRTPTARRSWSFRPSPFARRGASSSPTAATRPLSPSWSRTCAANRKGSRPCTANGPHPPAESGRS